MSSKGMREGVGGREGGRFWVAELTRPGVGSAWRHVGLASNFGLDPYQSFMDGAISPERPQAASLIKAAQEGVAAVRTGAGSPSRFCSGLR